ncbi:MAG: hypothetical protein QGD92_13720, partial [Gammaproteobacteria bacterium]|nr:hypothetical protein [Gammaproteobacteria bacterium]
YLTEVANDYTVDTDGTGITCLSAGCLNPGNWPLKVTYTRLWLDEDFDDTDDGDLSHLISNPGVATGPFINRSGEPCSAAARAVTATAGAYFGGLGQPYGGRSTVLVRAQGEESFIDTNGNGQYDYNEPFADLTEAFLDKNEDLVFGNGDPSVDDSRDQATRECYGPVAPVTDPSVPTDRCFQEGGEEEIFLDFDVNNKFDAGNQIYNGSLCPKAISDRTVICATAPCDEATERYCTRDPVDIRRSMVLVMSGSGAFMSVRDALNGEFISAVDLTMTFGEYSAFTSVVPNIPLPTTPIPPGTAFTIGDAASNTEAPPGTGETVSLTTGTSSVVVDMADLFNGVLPAGTGISYNTGTDGCEIQNTPISVVPNTSSFGFTQAFIALGRPANPPSGGAPVTVTVTTPDGNTQSAVSFSCSY